MPKFKTPKIRTISGTKYKIFGITDGTPKYAMAKYKTGNGPWLSLIDFDARRRLAAYLKAEKSLVKKVKK